MMSLSVQQIRDLNKIRLFVTSCSDPAGEYSDGSSSTAGVWSFGMYSEGGLGLEAPIKTTSVFGALPGSGFGATIVGQTLGSALQVGWGLVPQVDYPHKFKFQGSEPLSFSVKCYLVLATSVQHDFFAPLLRLFFLTYPRRTTDPDSGAAISVQDWFRDHAKELDASIQDWISALNTPSTRNIYNFLSKLSSGAADAVSGVSDFVDKYVGSVYPLVTPPTFRTRGSNTPSRFPWGGSVRYYQTSGSGLALGYGRTYVDDVFIRSLSVRIPELYYDGGFPQVIEVILTFETLRVATADMLYGAVTGRL